MREHYYVRFRTDLTVLCFVLLCRSVPLGSWPMMVVQIEKPANVTLAVWFAELRSWLDSNHCEPALFSPSGRTIDNMIFQYHFENDNHACRFASAFKKYADSIRRTIGTERLDFLCERRERAIS